MNNLIEYLWCEAIVFRSSELCRDKLTGKGLKHVVAVRDRQTQNITPAPCFSQACLVLVPSECWCHLLAYLMRWEPNTLQSDILTLLTTTTTTSHKIIS